MGIRLCTSFHQNSASTSFLVIFNRIGFSDSQRSTYLTQTMISHLNIGLLSVIDLVNIYHTLFLCATPRSFNLYSSSLLVRLTGAFFTGRPKIIPTCVQLDLSYFLQSYKTHIFRNTYIFSSKLASTISQGLNLTHLIQLWIIKIKYHHIQCAPNNGIGVKIAGRIKGHIQTRKMNALCLTSFVNRILDLGYISFRSSLGLIGVKVGTIIWW